MEGEENTTTNDDVLNAIGELERAFRAAVSSIVSAQFGEVRAKLGDSRQLIELPRLLMRILDGASAESETLDKEQVMVLFRAFFDTVVNKRSAKATGEKEDDGKIDKEEEEDEEEEEDGEEEEDKDGDNDKDSKEEIKKESKPVVKEEDKKIPVITISDDEEEAEAKPVAGLVKAERGAILKSIYSQESGPFNALAIVKRQSPSDSGLHVLKRVRFSAPPPPPPLPSVLPAGVRPAPVRRPTNMLTSASQAHSNTLALNMSIAINPGGPPTAAGPPLAPRNGCRIAEFEIVPEEFSICRRKEYLNEYLAYSRPLDLRLKSGTIQASGEGWVYTHYGAFKAFHVPKYRADVITHKLKSKGLKGRDDKREAFLLLFNEAMMKPSPKMIKFRIRLNEFQPAATSA